MLSYSNLHPYQLRAARFIIDNPFCALWVDLGLGKTITTLTAVEELINGVEVGKVLIIAPLRVANSVWAQEVKAWEHTRGLRVSVCTGDAREREAALRRDADIYVINRENIVWLVQKYTKVTWPFDCVVIDEASSFKCSKTKRWKALKAVRPFIRRMIQLTGTPAGNGLMDLWPQLYLLDLGQRLGRTKTGYRDRFFQSDYMGFKWTPKPDSEAKIHALVEDIALSLRADDYLHMPDRIDVTVRVPLPEYVIAQYKAFEREFVLTIGASGVEVDAVNAAVLAGKLQQICNGAIYTDELKNFAVLHNAKIEALRDIIDDNQGENILVAYQFKHDLARLQAAFPHGRVLDKGHEVIDSWNRGDVPLLFAHPACLHPSTEVLTENRGWVKIVDVMDCERVHDGEEFVSHHGCYLSGVKPVLCLFGIKMTENHKILIDGEWKEAKDVQDSKCVRRKASYSYTGNDHYLSRMLPLRRSYNNFQTKCGESKQRKKKVLPTVCKRYVSQNDGYSLLENMEGDERSTYGLRKIGIQKKQKIEMSEVYDLVDCGPRHRFLIRNANGEVFISHNSAGHGLNLQRGGAVVVWFGLNWSLELYEQLNGRLHRQGQTRPVRIMHLVASGCIDDRVLDAIRAKARTQNDLLNAIKLTMGAL